jgi:hypothetical protein
MIISGRKYGHGKTSVKDSMRDKYVKSQYKATSDSETSLQSNSAMSRSWKYGFWIINAGEM